MGDAFSRKAKEAEAFKGCKEVGEEGTLSKHLQEMIDHMLLN